MGIEIDDLRFEMEGDIDLRGFLGIADDVRPGYEDIVCTAYIDADASESELATLREQIEATSPVMNIIQSDVPLTTELVIE